MVASRRSTLSDLGVSLVELLVTVVIMGVVAGIAVPIYLNNQQSAAEGQLKADIGQAADYITAYVEGGDIVDTDTLPGPFDDLGGLSNPLSIQVAENNRDFCIAGQTRYGDAWYWSSTVAEFSQTATTGCPAPPPLPSSESGRPLPHPDTPVVSKATTRYRCTECGADYAKWVGRCGKCGSYNSVDQAQAEPALTSGLKASAKPVAPSKPAQTVGRIRAQKAPRRIPTGIGEFDRVLGGGLVPGKCA